MSKTLTKAYQLVGTGSNKAVGADTMYLKLYAKYESYSATTNTSKVVVKAVLNSRSGQTHDSGGRTLRITDNTTGKNSGDKTISKGNSSSNPFPSGDYTLYEWSETISHNADGTKSIEDSATFKLKAWGKTLSVTSDTLVLPNIPRKSEISVSKGGKDIVDIYVLIDIDRKSTGYTDTIAWSCSNLSETIQTKGSDTKIMLCFDDNSYNNVTPPSGYVKKRSSYSNVDLMNLFPSSKNINMVFTTTTYNGNTSLGSTSVNFNYETYKTTYLNNLSYEVTDNLTIGLTGTTNKVIKGISNVLVTNTPTKQINDNSGISSYLFTASNMTGVTQSANSYTFIGLLGSIIRSVVIDTRGWATSLSQGAIELDSTKFIEYFKPTIDDNGLVAERPEATSSTINILISGKFWNNSFGSTTNTLHLYYRLKVDDGDYGNYIEITPTTILNTFNYTGTIQVADTSSATIEVKVVDSTNSEYTLTTNITKGQSLFDIGEDVFKFNNNLAVDGSLAVGSSGSNKTFILNGKNLYDLFAPKQLEEFTSKVTFKESVAGNTHFYKQGNMCYVYFQGEGKTHSNDQLIATLPSGYRPSKTIFAPFVVNAGAYGELIINTNGNINVNIISSTSVSGRIYANFTYPL